MSLTVLFLTGEKKKTKQVDNERNPVWNEVSEKWKWTVMFGSDSMLMCMLLTWLPAGDWLWIPHFL